VGWVAWHLLERKQHVLLAWNGPFFAYSPDRKGIHIGPVVLDGKLLYNVGSHRWTFGERIEKGVPVFETMHLPSKAEIEGRHFSFAASGLQCLVRDGKPLKLEPFPIRAIKTPPVPSTPDEAGHIPINDHIRTSRTSLGWSRDNRFLYVLFVAESDNELESKLALKHGAAQDSGWTLDDLQRFWLSVGVWGVVNSDGGSVMQRVLRLPDGTYDLIAPEFATKRSGVLHPGEDFGHGTLMSFYVAD